MNQTTYTLPTLRCRCGYEWHPRYNRRPGVCPRCRARDWDKPYKRRRTTAPGHCQRT